MSVERDSECRYKYRPAASVSFCYTRRATERRCFKGNITMSDVATGDVFGREPAAGGNCQNEITLTATEEDKVYVVVQAEDRTLFLAVIGVLVGSVLVLTLVAGIAWRSRYVD